MESMESYDVIIIGGGPNGLCAGAYLARAGLKTLLLERKYEVGGGLATERVTLPSFRHNTHAIYHMMVDYAPPYKDLRLEEDYNLRYVFPEVQVAMIFSDQQSICMYQDVEKTAQSIAKFSKKDADSYRKWGKKFQDYLDEFLAAGTYARAVPAIEQVIRLEKTELGKEIGEISEKSPLTVVKELFENDRVRALMLYLATRWGLDYETQAMGYLIPIMLNRPVNTRLCVTGSHSLAFVLHQAMQDGGGKILTNEVIKRIIIENGEAKGVELSRLDGGVTRIEAKAVVSTIDVNQTFLQLVGEKNLPQEFAEKIKLFQWEKESLLTVHLALDGAPDFTAAKANPEINKGLLYILGYDTMQDVIDHHKAIGKGESCENRGIEVCFPTVHDPSQAPPGKHTGFIAQIACYDLNGKADNWYPYKFRREQGKKRIATLSKYAPNIADNVLWHTISTPKDIENKLIDMVRGSIKQGGYFPLQMGFNRPNDDASQVRTPVKNLYFCGAGAHSGGLITFGPGYNGANVVVDELGGKKWWPEPKILAEARKKGLLP